ncbi:hypothetical protein ABZP36_024803 [Zizania latifolia]
MGRMLWWRGAGVRQRRASGGGGGRRERRLGGGGCRRRRWGGGGAAAGGEGGGGASWNAWATAASGESWRARRCASTTQAPPQGAPQPPRQFRPLDPLRKWSKQLNTPLEEVDPEISDIIELEKARQWKVCGFLSR